ncbi:tetratricopeptide repeat protein [Longimicrobium sp.]|uniref:tetratricopeptide repeat protein n=1 Tax=Longimicrobium sp. TaxID=2029185 RepID=UPI002E3491AB|nr:tetratricopeptide repeat protein [Longimicrobium sp.]HEX6041172.1 tetratricopeptide repeat protein [Longimicrobium sp.]
MSFDPESTLRPLRQRASDLEALRAGAPAAALVVRVARAAETTLRRMLRDDPTAPVELRLRALSDDDLPTPDLLAELRRRNRLPMELAAAFHDLDLACERIAGGADPAPRDAPLAVAVAQGLDTHIRALPAFPRMEDPVLDDPDEEPLTADDEAPVRAVPAARGRRVPWPTLLALAGLVILLFVVVRMRRSDALERGEAAYRAGRVAQAEQSFRAYADDHPRDPRARVYLARIYREAGRLADAEREVQAGLRATPDDAGLHTEHGFVLLDANRPADAVPVFRKALDYDKEAPRAWAGLVRALRAAGRPTDADQVLRLAPAEVRGLIRTADARDSAAASASPASAPVQTP